ncbi:hypothetical protein L208DRAFT_39074 [Tricholoma matsutake]|nr:hypothetical protein L208DRAFT_39074 [Tricholoma matsutake 945]
MTSPSFLHFFAHAGHVLLLSFTCQQCKSPTPLPVLVALLLYPFQPLPPLLLSYTEERKKLLLPFLILMAPFRSFLAFG